MGRGKQIAVSLTACLSALACGTMLSFTSPVTLWLQDRNSDTAPFYSDEKQNSWIASLFPIGAFVGALPAGAIIGILGKKNTMKIFSVPWILCWIAIIMASNVYYLYVARFVQGLVTGILSTCVPTYIGEITEPSIRGTLGTFYQIFITVGICIVYILGAWESYLLLAIVCTVVSLAYTCGSFFLPESPLYLLRLGKEEEAIDVLKSLRAANYDEKLEVEDMKKCLEIERLGGPVSLAQVSTRANRRALIIGVGLQVVQQLSGINAVIFYTGTIFETAGASLSPNTSSIILGIVQIIATCVSASLTDKTGRRALLVWSAIVMGVCLAALGAVFRLKEADYKLGELTGTIPVISLLVFIVMFSIGFGPVPWVMIGELFSPTMKGFGSSMAVATNWFLAFAVTKLYPLVAAAIGNSVTFWIFSVICFAASFWIIFFIIETKGKTLKQIQDELAS